MTEPIYIVAGDPELITRVRGGDRNAFGELYRRHLTAATNLARQFAAAPSAVDDLVSESFARVLQALVSGKGPDTAFRAYLFTTLRHTAYDRTRKDSKIAFTGDNTEFDLPAHDPDLVLLAAENQLIGRAYGALPERWQAVLWYLTVEGHSPAETGRLLGMSANAVTSLAFRAREGLRETYLQAHLDRTDFNQCRAIVNRLGAWTRDGLSKRERSVVDAHLEICDDCRALAAELIEVNSGLRALLAPILLGSAALGYVALLGPAPAFTQLGALGLGGNSVVGTGTPAPSAAAPAGLVGDTTGWLRMVAHSPRALVTAGGVALATVVAVIVALAINRGTPAPPAADRNPSAAATATGQNTIGGTPGDQVGGESGAGAGTGTGGDRTGAGGAGAGGAGGTGGIGGTGGTGGGGSGGTGGGTGGAGVITPAGTSDSAATSPPGNSSVGADNAGRRTFPVANFPPYSSLLPPVLTDTVTAGVRTSEPSAAGGANLPPGFGNITQPSTLRLSPSAPTGGSSGSVSFPPAASSTTASVTSTPGGSTTAAATTTASTTQTSVTTVPSTATPTTATPTTATPTTATPTTATTQPTTTTSTTATTQPTTSTTATTSTTTQPTTTSTTATTSTTTQPTTTPAPPTTGPVVPAPPQIDSSSDIRINSEGAGTITMSALLTASDQQAPSQHTLSFLDTDGLVSLTTVDIQVGSSGALVAIRCPGNVCPFVGQPGQTVRIAAHIQVRTAELTNPAHRSRTTTSVRFGLDSSKLTAPAIIWLRLLTSATLTTSADIVPGRRMTGTLHLEWNAGVPARAAATVRFPATISAIALKVLSAPPACQRDSSGTFFACAVGRDDSPLSFEMVAMPLPTTGSPRAAESPAALALDVYDPLPRPLNMALPPRKPDPTPLDPGGMTGSYRAAMTGAALNESCIGVGGGPRVPTPCPSIDASTAVVVWAQLTYTAPSPAPGARRAPVVPVLYAGKTPVPTNAGSVSVISRPGGRPLLSSTATVQTSALPLLAGNTFKVASAKGVAGGWDLIVVWADPAAPPTNSIRVGNTLRWLGPSDTAPLRGGTTSFLYDFDSTKGRLTRWAFTSGHASSIPGRVASSHGARVFIAPTSGVLVPCDQEPHRAAKACKITEGLLVGPMLSGTPTPTPAPSPPVPSTSGTAL